MKPNSRIDALLTELCVDYGWCGAAQRAADFTGDVLSEPGDVVDALLRAEGQDPASSGSNAREFLTRLVEDWLFDPHGRGANSGLPLTG